VVGIEATGSMGWFLRLMEELTIECRVGHPTAIRKAETRRQKHDRRDAVLLLQLAYGSRLRRPERGGCVLTSPTSLEMS
jgi:transposase